MRVTIVPVTPFQQNCSVLVDEATHRAAVVDPGGDLERIEAVLAREGATLEKVLLTHGHVDHAAGAAELARRHGVPVEGPGREDAFWLEALPEQARTFGLGTAEAVVPDRWLAQGDEVRFGDERLEVLATPGHTPGHVVFHHPAGGLVLVGDVLFQGSIGRTDFPRGDYDTLIASIRDVLLPLGDDVRFVPGHGPGGTLGEERRTNPFLVAPERYRELM
ncbi:MAG: MBL fold metallo-hydrolase [Planctomycetes bacterium]|nr:MBL fold metallo-hydrolase [Planctomycetota bacterium]